MTSRSNHIAEAIRRDLHLLEDAERHALIALLHPHGAAKDVNRQVSEAKSRGDRIADRVTGVLGSWPFIIVQSVMLGTWVVLNVIGWINHWDPYPFILLNLALSFQAAYSAPIIMMSQNRQAEKDRLVAANDFLVNVKSETEVAAIQRRLDDLAGRQWDALLDLQNQQIEMLAAIHDLTRQLHSARPS